MGFLADNAISLLAFAGGLIMMMSILTRRTARLYRRSRKSSPKRAVRQVKAEADKQMPRQDLPLLDAPGKYTRWHAEMHNICREAEAMLDTKIVELQATIRLANEAIVRLEQLQQTQLQQTQLQQPDDRPASESQAQPSQRGESRHAEPIDEPIDEAVDEAVVELFDEQTLARIERLSQEGRELRQVAELIGLPLGDIELALSTRPPNRKAPASPVKSRDAASG